MGKEKEPPSSGLMHSIRSQICAQLCFGSEFDLIRIFDRSELGRGGDRRDDF